MEGYRVGCRVQDLFVAEWIHCAPFWDNTTHYKTKSVHFLGLMNSATKLLSS